MSKMYKNRRCQGLLSAKLQKRKQKITNRLTNTRLM